MTLADGTVHGCAAGEFVLLEGGGVAVSQAVLADLVALSQAVSGPEFGVIAGGLAALGVAAGASSGTASADGRTQNTPAVITGTTTGFVTEDTAVTNSSLTASGSLGVTDADLGEAVFLAQVSTAGIYGTFALSANGSWTYTADNTQSAIQSLGLGDLLTDTFTAV